MCYRLHRMWGCGPAAKHHKTINIILCANPCPCDEKLWVERFQAFPNCSCESCSGERFPRWAPTEDKWSSLSPASESLAVGQYLGHLLGLANAFFHSSRSSLDCKNEPQIRQFEKEFLRHYPTLLRETMCRAHNSDPGMCCCVLSGVSGWAYNMAIVLRHRTADVALEKYFLAHGLAFCPEGREKIDVAKKTALGYYNQLGKNKIVEMGYESTKMPSFCEQEFLIGYGDFVLSINPWRNMNGDPKQQARAQLAKCLGLMVLADSGISPHRRDPILNCLVHLVGSREDIVRMPALEDTYSLILVQSPTLAVQELLRWITRHLILKNRDLRRALLCLSMHWNTFERSVEALGEELLLPTEQLCPASNCNRPLRFADFQITEPAVRPLTCDCVVGRRCLFKHLMFQSIQDLPIWTCPACNTEIANLARTLPVPIQSLIHITKYAPLPHELEQHEPGVARLFAEKSPMT